MRILRRGENGKFERSEECQSANRGFPKSIQCTFAKICEGISSTHVHKSSCAAHHHPDLPDGRREAASGFPPPLRDPHGSRLSCASYKRRAFAAAKARERSFVATESGIFDRTMQRRLNGLTRETDTNGINFAARGKLHISRESVFIAPRLTVVRLGQCFECWLTLAFGWISPRRLRNQETWKSLSN